MVHGWVSYAPFGNIVHIRLGFKSLQHLMGHFFFTKLGVKLLRIHTVWVNRYFQSGPGLVLIASRMDNCCMFVKRAQDIRVRHSRDLTLWCQWGVCNHWYTPLKSHSVWYLLKILQFKPKTQITAKINLYKGLREVSGRPNSWKLIYWC